MKYRFFIALCIAVPLQAGKEVQRWHHSKNGGQNRKSGQMPNNNNKVSKEESAKPTREISSIDNRNEAIEKLLAKTRGLSETEKTRIFAECVSILLSNN